MCGCKYIKLISNTKPDIFHKELELVHTYYLKQVLFYYSCVVASGEQIVNQTWGKQTVDCHRRIDDILEASHVNVQCKQIANSLL